MNEWILDYFNSFYLHRLILICYVDKLILNEHEWTKTNSRKSVRWSAVPVPCLSRLWLKLRGEQGSGPEGVDDLCFHTYGEFSPPSSPSYPPSPQPPGPYLSLEAHIPASRPKSQPWGPYLSHESQIPTSKGEEGGGENSPYVWKHRSSTPLGPLPKKDEKQRVKMKKSSEMRSLRERGW